MEPDWERASVTDEDGQLDRPGALAGWTGVKNARVEDGRLRWEDALTTVQPDARLLERFVRLATAKDAAIAAFANQYGVLRLCEHGLPASHNPRPYGFTSGVANWCRPGFKDGEWVDAEPAATWRLFSAQAHAILNIAAAVHAGRPGAERDWAVVYERSGRHAPWWHQGHIVDALNLAQVVNEWLELGNVRPMLVGRELRMASSGGLFGAIALRLASAVAGARSVFLCDYCGNPIDLSIRQRRPAIGRRAFCDECRAAGVPARVRAEESRRRRAAS